MNWVAFERDLSMRWRQSLPKYSWVRVMPATRSAVSTCYTPGRGKIVPRNVGGKIVPCNLM